MTNSGEFRVKLLQLWIFDSLCGKDWKGIWETIGLYNQGTEKERWRLRRAVLTGLDQSFEDRRDNIPTWLLLESAKCVKFETVYAPNQNKV